MKLVGASEQTHTIAAPALLATNGGWLFSPDKGHDGSGSLVILRSSKCHTGGSGLRMCVVSLCHLLHLNFVYWVKRFIYSSSFFS